MLVLGELLFRQIKLLYILVNMKILPIFIITVALGYLTTNAQMPVQRKYKLPLCTRKVAKRYFISEPAPCSSKSRSLNTLKVNITPPIDNHVDQEAFICRRQEVSFECTKGFFGSTACVQVYEIFTDVQTEECRRIEITHQSEVGTLTPSDENTLKTNNVLKPKFNWLATNTIIVPNIILSYTSVVADLSDGSVSHALLENLSCIELDQILSCREEGWRLITSRVKQERCKQPRVITDALLEVFTLEGGKLYRVQDANIVFTKLLKCDDATLKCLPSGAENTRCTATGYAVTLPKTFSSATTAAKSVKMPAKLKILESAIASSSYSSKLELEILKSQLNEMLCKNSRATLVSLLAAQRSTPSAVLSLLIGRKTQAVYRHNALYELQCQDTTAVLQPSLEFNGKVARYPLFNSYLGSSTVVAQLTDEGYLTQNVQYSLNPATKQAFILQGKFIVFANNTLTEERPALEKIVINEKLTIAASNFTFSEEMTLLDLAEVARPEEAVSNQALINLIALNKKDFRNRGIDVAQYLEKGHLPDEKSLEETLQSKWSLWEVVRGILHATNTSWTAITMIGISIIVLRLYLTRRKRRRNEEGEAEPPVEEKGRASNGMKR